MTNTDEDLGPPSFIATQQLAIDDTRTSLAGLKAQVGGIERDYAELKGTLGSLDRKLETGMLNLNTQFQNAISAIHNKLDDRQKTPWSALGVMLTAFIAFVAFAYWPIHSAETETKANLGILSKDFVSLLTALPNSFVTHKERAETTAQVSANTDKIAHIIDDISHNYVNYREHDRFNREMEANIATIRKDVVVRAEVEQHWLAIKDREEALQKQLDVLRTDFGSVYTTRDQLQRIQHDLDESRAQMMKVIHEHTRSSPQP